MCWTPNDTEQLQFQSSCDQTVSHKSVWWKCQLPRELCTHHSFTMATVMFISHLGDRNPQRSLWFIRAGLYNCDSVAVRVEERARNQCLGQVTHCIISPPGLCNVSEEHSFSCVYDTDESRTHIYNNIYTFTHFIISYSWFQFQTIQ